MRMQNESQAADLREAACVAPEPAVCADPELLKETAERVYRYMTAGRYEEWGTDIEHWDWVPGVGLIAIMEYGTGRENESAIRYVEQWVERNRGKAASAKTVNAMAPFAVYPELYRRTGRAELLSEAGRIAAWMLDEAPRTREGAFEHTVTEPASFPEQAWADTVFMAALFLARCARLTGDCRVAEEALRQTLLHLRLLQDERTGALFHGWDCGAADHLSAALWCRANAWIACAVPEIAAELSELVPESVELRERYVRMAEGLRALQAEDGLWHTVMDRPDFYKESSGSAGIACGFIKAVRGGLLPAEYLASAALAVKGLLPLVTSKGEVKGVSGGTPVLPSVDAYNRIPQYPTLYGQGLTLMLLTEAAAGVEAQHGEER